MIRNQLKSLNYIRCKFCGWQTMKWGRNSNPAKAFMRLKEHITLEHYDQIANINAHVGKEEETDA
jgi:hypothetical protein